MDSKKAHNDSELSTEQKIKNAARKVFHEKGFSATRTRDIAEEAGINLALLNYYFRSKQKLFDIIMAETMQDFLKIIGFVINNAEATLEQKVEALVTTYIDQLIVEPQIALFIITEIKNNPKDSVLTSMVKTMIANSVFVKQYEQAVDDGKIPPVNIFHFLINVVGLTVFPFIGAPIMKNIGDMSDREFKTLMLERKKLIPAWIKTMFFLS